MRYIAAAVTVVGLVFAAPAAAHHLTVDPPGGGNGTSHWVGGPPTLALPEAASGTGLHASPIGMMPAAHSAGPNDDKGLVSACLSTTGNPSAAQFAAPPFFTGCMHGQP